jgi:hypothetical protein
VAVATRSVRVRAQARLADGSGDKASGNVEGIAVADWLQFLTRLAFAAGLGWLTLLFRLEARGVIQAKAWRRMLEQAKALGMAGRRQGG